MMNKKVRKRRPSKDHDGHQDDHHRRKEKAPAPTAVEEGDHGSSISDHQQRSSSDQYSNVSMQSKSDSSKDQPMQKEGKEEQPKEKKESNTSLTIVRWTLVGFCFLVFAFSLTLLILSSMGYVDMRTAFDELQTMKKMDNDQSDVPQFRPEGALIIFYVGIVLGIVFMLISLMGCVGGLEYDRCYLITYSVVMAVFLIGSFAGIAIAWSVHYDDLNNLVKNILKEFIQHLYGRPQVLVGVFGLGIDKIQKAHRCCGVLDTVTENATMNAYGATSTQYTALFWLESTQWGQIQMENINYTEGSMLLWTPTSCCRQESPKCAQGRFEDQYEWTQEKEMEWKWKIYSEGCGQYLLQFDRMESNDRANVIAGIVVSTLVFVASIVLAVLMVVFEN